ncbi:MULTISPECIES: glycerophosphoryl diester phosphodiesterase membrane domain-containing protein [unclassified Streptococcus]|uniref:glycerophosphoryl diester phosphodiesterase membrane domain-containing protein n=1 Tax=unclassified Streptococcus TaxID=2608887 RepID=UPI001071A85D|nr:MULTISPECIES: glycerophosphodiester phosphodiesterase [unclassified Streptococcus]MBF0805919.1 glycerophosphodiester phosphodiesterase [Streptococcus sp. 19428wA2_WM07]TFU28537.1 glycerophosphodiester phosphodiesterase [Streptococcus sp. WM07]
MKKIFTDVGKVFKGLGSDLWTYFIRIGILQILIGTIGAYLLEFSFRFILFSADQESLRLDNLMSILLNPVSLIALLFFLVVTAGLIFFEMTALSLIVYGAYQQQYFSWRDIFQNTWISFSKQRWLDLPVFLLYLISLIPVANLGFGPSLTSKLYIPAFITGELTKSTWGSLLLPILFLLVIYINVRLIFTLSLISLEQISIRQAIWESWELTRTGKSRLLGAWIVTETLIALLAILIVLLTVWSSTVFDPNGQSLVIQSFFLTIIEWILYGFTFLSKISLMTFLLWEIIHQNRVAKDLVAHRGQASEKRLLLYLGMLLAFLLFMAASGLQLVNQVLNKEQLTIAHRGFVKKAVENSLEGIKASKEAGADLVEMDVLMTKDHKLVVMHDYNLNRLAGLDKKVADMTYDEVVGLPLTQDGHQAKLPSFEEFVQVAKENNIRLLVELKPHGSEPEDYVDLVLEELNRLDPEHTYPVMSLKHQVMRELEDKEPQIETGYVIPFNFGDLQMDQVDFLAVEEFSYPDQLVEEAKEAKKPLYIWTINEDTEMVRYLQTPLDGMITDFPDKVQAYKGELSQQSNYWERLLRIIEDIQV